MNKIIIKIPQTNYKIKNAIKIYYLNIIKKIKYLQ